MLGGKGIGGGVRSENNAYCFLLRMAHLLILAHNMVEYEKVLIYSPDLRMVLIFLVTKVFQKGTVFK